MDITNIENLFYFVGGLGMFLYGTNILSQSMQKAFGNSTKNILKKLTSNPFMGIIVGAFVTAIIQASAATTVMVIGFVNAGLMTFNQAIGVIMGANIGTTITAWLISLMELGETSKFLDPTFYAPLILGFSAFVIIFSKKEKSKNIGSIFIGIGFLFVGLSFMSSSVKLYSQSPILIEAFTTLSKNPFLGLLTGLIVTAILQSSSASMSILQTLTLTGTVSRNAAVFIIFGQNIGTCVTALLSSLSAGRNAKKTALFHLLFNVIGAFIFIMIIYVTYPFTHNFMMLPMNLIEISIFHTFFNVTNTLVLLPFSNLLIKLINHIMGDDNENLDKLPYSEKVKRRLDERTLNQPLLAFDTVSHVVVSYAKYSLENLKRGIDVILNEYDEDKIEEIYNHEEEIDKSYYGINDYLVLLNTKPLNEEQHKKVDAMMGMLSDIERISDHGENLAENAKLMLKDEICFTQDAINELRNIGDRAIESVEYAIDSIENDNEESIMKVRETEDLVDDLTDELKENHIKRINEGKCMARSGVIFFEIITNLERVSDHALNLSDYVYDLKHEKDNKKINIKEK